MGLIWLLLAIDILLWHSRAGLIPRSLHPALAVQCFYAVSGFLIQMVIITKYQKYNRWQLRFYVSRLLRIYPSYLLFFLLTTLLLPNSFSYLWQLDNPLPVITWIANNVFIFGQDVLRFFYFNSVDQQFMALPTDEAARAAVYGQGLAVGMTSLGQSWTLAIELYFYLLAPLLLRRSTIVILAITAISVTLRFALGHHFGSRPELLYGFFPIEIAVFLLGAVTYRAYAYFFESGRVQHWLLHVYAGDKTLLFICTLVVSICCRAYMTQDLNFVSSHVSPRLASLAGSWNAPPSAPTGYWLILLLTIFSLPFAFHFSHSFAFDRFVGELSYPVYISHFLIIELLTRKLNPSDDGLRYVGVFVLVFSLLSSLVMVQWMEKPLDRLRHKLAGVMA